MNDEKYTFVEHLDEFRKRLIYCLLSFGITSAACWNFVPAIIKYISIPAGKLVFLHPAEAFSTYFKMTLWGGFFLSLPIIIYNIWKYVEEGLLPQEKKYILIFAPFSLLLFLLGTSFGFFVAIPLAVKFLISFGSGLAEPMLSISEYISFIGGLLLVFGTTFELPLVIFFMAKLKIVNTQMLKMYRKHAILGIVIVSAIVTPTPDALTQALLAIPLIILFELSVQLSNFA